MAFFFFCAIGFNEILTGESQRDLAGQFIRYQDSNTAVANELMTPGAAKVACWGSPTANRVTGTNGEKFRRGLVNGETVEAWVSDVLRSVPLENKNEETMDYKGIKLLKMTVPDSVFQNSTVNPENSVYYMEGTAGFYNLTSSRQRVPIFVSQPHFLGIRDPAVLEKVSGFTPDAGKHQLFLGVEPTSGLTIFARKRSQINFLINKPPVFSNEEDGAVKQWLPYIQNNTYFPIAWQEEGGGADDKLASTFRSQVYAAQGLATKGKWIGGILGLILTLTSVYLFYRAGKLAGATSFPTPDINEPLLLMSTNG